MAKYSPGIPPGIIRQAVLNVPLLFSSGNRGTAVLQPESENFELVKNRFEIDNAAGRFIDPGDYIVFPENGIWELQQWTISAWVLLIDEQIGVNNPITGVLSSGMFPANLSFGLLAADMVPGVFFNDGSIIQFAFAFAAVSPGEWHHYAATFSGNQIRFFLDGVVQQQMNFSGPIPFADAYYFIGNDGSIPDGSNAEISDITLFDQVLSDGEIAELFQTTWLRKGSREGSVLQRSGKSFAIRTRRVPTRKNSNRVTEARSAFTSQQSRWRNVPPADQATWAAETPNFPRVNSLGESYDLSSLQLFSSQNIPLVYRNLPPVDQASAPIVFPSPTVSEESFATGSGIIRVVLSPQVVPNDFLYELWSGPPSLTLPSDFRSVTYVLIHSFSPGQSTAFNIATEWIDRFGSIVNLAGSYIPYRYIAIHIPTGQRSILITNNWLAT